MNAGAGPGAHRSRARTQSLPVVMLTTSSEDADIASSYQLGANSFVRKPVVFSEFVSAAKMLGMYWLLINQPAPEWQ
jgi:two-component system, response regulator